MRFVLEYNEYVINEAFEFDILKSFLGVGAASLLGIIAYIIIDQFKLKMGKKLIGDFDPVLHNKFSQYEKQIQGKISKKELFKLFKIFYSDNVLKSYLQKIAAAKNDDEKKYLHQQADEYIKTKLTPEQFKNLNLISYRGEANYQVTPIMVKEFDGILKSLFTDINDFISKQDMLPIEHFDITGGSYNWREDIKESPNKKYYDIDCIVTYPLLPFNNEIHSKNADQEKTLELYNNLFIEFVEKIRPKYLDANLTYNLNRSKLNKKLIQGLSLAVNINNMVLIIDLIPTFGPYREWTVSRMQPEKDIKGLTYGFIYRAMERALLIDVTGTGVVTWVTPKSNILKSKIDTGAKYIHNISRNYETFLLDIAKWFGTTFDVKMKIHPLLNANPGLKQNNIHLDILMYGLKGLVLTLDNSGIFEKGIIPDIYNYKDCLSKIRDVYFEELNKALYNPKYNNMNKDLLLKNDYDRVKNAVDYAKNLAEKILK